MATTVAAGAVPLLEAAKCGTDMLKRGVVETIIRDSAVAESIMWAPFAGNALESTEEVDLGSVQFRSVNETYDRDFGSDKKHFWGVTILGGEVFVDNFLLRVTSNKDSVKAKQYAKKAKATALTLDKYVVDGTGTAKDFKGFNALISEGFGQALTTGATAATTDVTTGTAAALSLDDLDVAFDLMRQGPPEFALMNRFHRRKITRLARTSITGVALMDTTTDSFGRRLTTWNDVPFRIVGMDTTGTDILGFDETAGGSSVASSIYFVKPSEDDGVCGLLGAGGSFEVADFGEQQSAPGAMGRIEFYPGLAVFSKYALVRIAAILQS